MKPLLVIKYGTACLTDQQGVIETRVIAEIAEQLHALNKKFRLILVSSGAVGAGKKWIKKFAGTLSQRKAAAAIGNPVLMQTYAKYFSLHGVAVAQTLCERHHFSNRSQFLQLKKTLETLWENNVIPIANENDVMSDKELKFSDNDQLAMMLAINFGAQKILFGTNAPGLWDEDKQVIPVIETFDAKIFSLVRPNDSTAGGLGGMATKLTYADMATKYGVEAIIFSGKTPQSIVTSMNGETGTCCKSQGCQIPARKKWLAVSSLSLGKIFVDDGAAQAIRNRKSLLSVGAKKIEGIFEKNAVIQICNLHKPAETLAVAQAEFSSIDSKKSLTEKKSVILAHANKIVLL